MVTEGDLPLWCSEVTAWMCPMALSGEGGPERHFRRPGSQVPTILFIEILLSAGQLLECKAGRKLRDPVRLKETQA